MHYYKVREGKCRMLKIYVVFLRFYVVRYVLIVMCTTIKFRKIDRLGKVRIEIRILP